MALLASDGAGLHGLLYRLTLRADAADDLMQELFLRLRGSDAFARAQDRRAYAYRTAINLASAWRKRQRAARASPPDAGPASAAVHADPTGGLIRAEQHAQVLDG